MYTEEQLMELVYPVKDPEIDASIVDIGLIYGIEQRDSGDVYVRLTLTSPQCPLGPEIIEDIEQTLESDDNITAVYVDLTFDPPWTPDRFSEELKIEFGYPV